MTQSLKKTFGFVCLALLCTLVACTSDIDTSSINNPTAEQTKGVSATIILPVQTISKTIDIATKETTKLYTVTLGDQDPQTVSADAGSVTFTNLPVGASTLTVTAWADEDKTQPIEYQSKTVEILANSTNQFTAELDFIYADTADAVFSDLKGTVSIAIDWSSTANTKVKEIQLIDDSADEGSNVLATQKVEENATNVDFIQQVPFTKRKGQFVHFRFLDANGKELGTSGMEVLRAAANQTSNLVDPFNQGNVSTLTLSSSALNESKPVTSASLAYTGKSGELRLSWTMPSSYSGVAITFYAENNAQNATMETLSKSEMAGMYADGAFTKTYTGLSEGTVYYATLAALHNDDGVDYASATITVNKLSPIVLTGLSINELGSDQILQKGRAVTFTASTTPENATDLGYTWSSSNESIFAVEDAKAGVFRVKGFGKATITVKSDAYDAVSTEKDFTVTLDQVKNVVARPNTGNLGVSWTAVTGATSYTLTKYADGTGTKTIKDITETSWTDTELKTGVSYQYTVQANAEIDGVDISGTTSAKSEAVTVPNPTITIAGATTSQVIANASLTGSTELVKGQSFTISLQNDVEGVTKYLWYLNGTSIDNGTVHTSGLDVITIGDETPGLLTSKVGQVQYLTLVMNDGTKDYSATYQFTYVSTPVESVVLDNVPENLTVVRGTKTQLTAHVMPLDADVQTITWKSSNTNLATIDADGNITVASDLSKFSDEERKVTFTATSTSNDNVKVETGEIALVAPVESISITNATRTLFVGGKNGYGTEQLAVTYLPADANESEKVVTGAYSSDDGIATIDDSLSVTAINGGHPTITIEGKNDTKATWQPTILKGHIWEYKKIIRNANILNQKSTTTELNSYVEGSTVDTTGQAANGNEYYFRVIYTDSASSTPDSSTFQDLSALGLSISYKFTDGSTTNGIEWSRYDLVAVNGDVYAFEVLRQANTNSSGVNVTVKLNDIELQTLGFKTSH